MYIPPPNNYKHPKTDWAMMILSVFMTAVLAYGTYVEWIRWTN